MLTQKGESSRISTILSLPSHPVVFYHCFLLAQPPDGSFRARRPMMGVRAVVHEGESRKI
jgi:hypothetical protein